MTKTENLLLCITQPTGVNIECRIIKHSKFTTQRKQHKATWIITQEKNIYQIYIDNLEGIVLIMSEFKLKNCPFCGGECFWIEVTKRWMKDDNRPFNKVIYDAKITCVNCGGGIENIAHDTEEDALKEVACDWNRRVDEDKTGEGH